MGGWYSFPFAQASTLGIWGLLLVAVTALIKTWPIILQRSIEAKAQVADEDAKLRGDLLKRIGDLEHELAEERRRCADELTRLQGQLTGVTRQFVAFQLATAQAIPPSSMTPEMVHALAELTRIVGGATDEKGLE